MPFSPRRHSSLAHLSFLLGSLGLGGVVLGTPACGTTPPVTGSGGAAAGGAPTSGGAPGTGGQGSGGQGSGGTPGGTGGGSGGEVGTGGAGTGGSASGGNGSGGEGSGGAPADVFACPPGSESMVPNLAGTPAPLPGTLPAAPGGGSNSIMEGPLWIGSTGTLYLSQIRDYGPLNPAQVLMHDGSNYSIWVPDSGTNGLALRADGMILAASHGIGGLAEIDPAATAPVPMEVIADYLGSRLNSPNDLAIRADGNVYFTDPDYQCASPCDQDDNRVYRYPAAGGALEEIPTGHTNPNGITLSLDGSQLYVAGPGGIEVYTLDAAGAVTAGPDPWNDMSLNSVDGLSIDCAGNVYAAANGEVTVLDPEGGELDIITVPNQTTNVAFGGATGTVLYITTMSSAGVYSLDVGIPGSPY